MKMKGYFESGEKIEMYSGHKATILKPLGEGGRSKVYLVEYDGREKVLRWNSVYRMGNDAKWFYENMKNNVQNGSPAKGFLWTEDISIWTEDGFGELMDICPDGYYELPQYILGKQSFKSYKNMMDAALRIISAFRILHNRGYCYQVIEPQNIWIHPDKGEVLITGCENVVPDRCCTKIMWNYRYIAPEIVMGKDSPNKKTDWYSLAVILFLLFCHAHPLEGKRWREAQLTEEAQRNIYGFKALFVFDPDDDSNKAEQNIYPVAIHVWEVLPSYMKDLFLQAFSKKALLENPNTRPAEVEWIHALVRFRSEIVGCSCGNEVFTKEGRPCECEVCGKKAEVPFRLEFRRYSIPGVADSRIYQCQLGTCRVEEALAPVGRVISKKDAPEVLGIRNLSKEEWKAVTPSGKEKLVMPGEVVPLINGIRVIMGSETIRIQANVET